MKQKKNKEQSMERKIQASHWSLVIIAGAVWGLSEAVLGLGLEKCASLASGSIMTGLTFFFMAATWALVNNVFSILLLVTIASLFKLFDALLLSLPVHSGAVANPIFAFLLEGLAFFVIISIIRKSWKEKTWGQALTGGLAAVGAVGLFPLVKFATGIPACVFPGTSTPLSIYYAPLAIALSLLSVPLGFRLGKSLEARADRIMLLKLATPAAFLLCLILMALIRLG
jgi:hypothetical protein